MHEQSENTNKDKETIQTQPNRNNRAEKYNWNKQHNVNMTGRGNNQ